MKKPIQEFEKYLKFILILLFSHCSTQITIFEIPGEAQCFQCPEKVTFPSIIDRFQHDFKIHSMWPNFKCATCSEEFYENHLLTKHIKKRHPEMPPNIHRNEIILSEPEDLKCKLCPAAFYTIFAFYYHIYENHKPMKESLECQICGKSLPNVMDFKRHILIIHGGYTHACLICGKRYGYVFNIFSKIF